MQPADSQKEKRKKHSTLIDVKGVSVVFGVFEALKDVTVTVQKGARIGLVGPNGAGKSTLMKLLAGQIHPDAGTVVQLGDGISIGYLPQIPTDDELAALRRTEGEDLSGGEKTKRLLSDLFSHQHDVYLLDEPTNNLDAEGLDWLTHEITKASNASAAFVIVSHDRDFLDRAVNEIFEVNEETRRVRQFSCTYSEYREIRSKEIEDQWKDFNETSDEQKRLKKSLEQRGSWIKKIEQTRANNRKLDPGEKEKPPAAYLRDKEGRAGKRAKVMNDRVEQAAGALEVLVKPTVKLPINLEFENIERSGEIVFELKGASFAYGQGSGGQESSDNGREGRDGRGGGEEKAVGPFDLEVKYGDRIHISGNNGSGKTTLIGMLLGTIIPTSGEMRVGARVKIGYLPQENVFDAQAGENIIDAVCDILEVVRNDKEEGLLRMTLKRFGFEEADARKSMGQLSAGERSRLQLALMKLMKANCVILDEPTNHLDIESVEALEKALREFEGTLIVASHDRRFVEKISLTREVRLGSI